MIPLFSLTFLRRKLIKNPPLLYLIISNNLNEAISWSAYKCESLDNILVVV